MAYLPRANEATPVRIPNTQGVAYIASALPNEYDAGQLNSEFQKVQRAIAGAATRTITGPTTQLPSDRVILVNTAGGTIVVTLLPPTGWSPFPVTIKNVGGSLTTIVGLIDGVNNVTLTQNAMITLVSDGVSIWASAKTVTAVPPTVLLMHFDGANGSTSFPDAEGNTVTRSGNVVIDTSMSVFGGSSAHFTAAGDFLTITSAASLGLMADFTIEGWVNTTVTTQLAALIEKSNVSFNTGSWLLAVNSVVGDGQLNFYYAPFSGATPVLQATTVSIRDGLWHHVAVCCSGLGMLMFIDGVLVAQAGNAGIPQQNTSSIFMGKSIFAGRDFVGWLDEWRMVKGQAMYTKNFTVPSAPFSP